MRTDREYALELDRQDELASFRKEFVIDEPELIYLDGNSLGRLPVRTASRMRKVVDKEWGRSLVGGWGEGWFTAPQRIGGKIARLIGADADEVVVADSTSVNLYKLIVAALRAQPGRNKIVSDDLNFPSDLYVMQGALELPGPDYHLELAHSPDGITVPVEALAAAIDADTALIALTHTAFKSGASYDLNAVTELAHHSGALVLWDLCHSVGVLPLALDAAGADLAVGCTYKYLNGGPGSPAFLFVRRELQSTLVSPIRGWFGQRGQFDFNLEYQPADGIRRFLAGSPGILSLTPVETGVDLTLEAGIDRIRAKSVRQTEYLVGLWREWLEPLGVKLNSPRDAQCRGSHVSLGHPDGLRIDRALIEDMKVIPDFRYPDNIRLGIAPLYTTFAEIHEGMTRLKRVLDERTYEKYPIERPEVT